mmetsp:Transcript_38589/g.87671  ORF Transcript_38589/g.87671 Transcript_38589/m.87671 type:complete len:200 (+) Transcript_38589:1791-2390(+)
MTPLHLGERSLSKYSSSCVESSTKKRSFHPPPMLPFFSIQPFRISDTGFSGATSSRSLTHFCRTSSLSAARVHRCSGRMMSSRLQPGGPRSHTPRAFLMSIAPASHGHASSDFQRRTPSDCSSNLAVFQHACPSGAGTCIFISAAAMVVTSAGGGAAPPPVGVASPPSPEQTCCSWRIQISCVLAESARSCHNLVSVTM